MDVIAELDEKKNEALEKTWKKVNKDFGSIFSTLLKGSEARLEPPEGVSSLLCFFGINHSHQRTNCFRRSKNACGLWWSVEEPD
jgi:hypothetical protein